MRRNFTSAQYRRRRAEWRAEQEREANRRAKWIKTMPLRRLLTLERILRECRGEA